MPTTTIMGHENVQNGHSSTSLSITASSKPSTPFNEKANADFLEEREELSVQSRDTDGNSPRTGEEGQKLEPTVSLPPSVNNVASIPNGGLAAWLQVVGSFFLFFNSW